ncbi:hypothetical protein PR202_ga11326 [Eleusine coracana subsp. coracana]|uniref:Uncharacterized protein n=1 Tax=Eleusine coracana subsp. coracana TaxID=191504 RepID=A0AAV5C8Y5_ELECO|nr:hypothetical protein PR202_ga11326 [Eleusine coracana subsp. coracana]
MDPKVFKCFHFVYRDNLVDDDELSASSSDCSIFDTLAGKLMAAADKYELPRLRLLYHAVDHVEAGPEQDPEGAGGAVADQEQNQGKPRSENATVEGDSIGRASVPTVGTSSGSCAQMKMRIRSLLAGTLTTILMDEHGFELFQHDGWRYTTGLHHRGFPTLLWEMLRALGYEEQPMYRGRETRRHGVPFAEVHLSVSPHPRNPDLAGMESTVTVGSLREGLERVAHRALTHFCGRNGRVRRVSRDDYPEYHTGYHRVAHYSEYLLNLDEESSSRSRVLLADAEQVWLQRNDLQTQVDAQQREIQRLTAALEASETRVTEITEQRDTLAQEVDR